MATCHYLLIPSNGPATAATSSCSSRISHERASTARANAFTGVCVETTRPLWRSPRRLTANVNVRSVNSISRPRLRLRNTAHRIAAQRLSIFATLIDPLSRARANTARRVSGPGRDRLVDSVHAPALTLDREVKMPRTGAVADMLMAMVTSRCHDQITQPHTVMVSMLPSIASSWRKRSVDCSKVMRPSTTSMAKRTTTGSRTFSYEPAIMAVA